MRALGFAFVAVTALSGPARSQSVDTARFRHVLREYRRTHEVPIARELMELLAIPNLASDRADIRRNAEQLRGMLERRGMKSEWLEVEGSPPAVYGELLTPGATRTVVFYAHYDGQPVDTAKWTGRPWTPVLRDRALTLGGQVVSLPADGPLDPEWRIYARSASDDKAPIVAMLAALDALRASGTAPSVNLKFFLEGEEEAGSDHLGAMLRQHRDRLQADLWIFGDGPVHQSRRPQVVFGVRGVLGASLTIYGPARPLHSGHYGNWAPNPNAMMVRLLASLRDEEGKITIPGFYDHVRPLSTVERKALASIPPVEQELAGELRLGRTEGAPASLAERISQPALNISGLAGGRAGQGGANVIGAVSEAYLDFRLVPDQTVDEVERLVEAEIRAHGYFIVRTDPDSTTLRAHPKVIKVAWGAGYPAVRTALDRPATQALLRVADQAVGGTIIRVPTLGGSLPLYHFQQVLGAPLVIVPIVNHDNNQHAENENLRLQNLWDGMELYAWLVARLGTEWSAVP
jgi:acetylornithine deacetylase/succinyl-diaminopimelate desuccinylase-like protein